MKKWAKTRKPVAPAQKVFNARRADRKRHFVALSKGRGDTYRRIDVK
jgi:hypothetical protein